MNFLRAALYESIDQYHGAIDPPPRAWSDRTCVSPSMCPLRRRHTRKRPIPTLKDSYEPTQSSAKCRHDGRRECSTEATPRLELVWVHLFRLRSRYGNKAADPTVYD